MLIQFNKDTFDEARAEQVRNGTQWQVVIVNNGYIKQLSQDTGDMEYWYGTVSDPDFGEPDFDGLFIYDMYGVLYVTWVRDNG